MCAIHLLSSHQKQHSIAFSSTGTQTDFHPFPHRYLSLKDVESILPFFGDSQVVKRRHSLADDPLENKASLIDDEIPVLEGCLAVLICESEKITQVADHNVYFVRVLGIMPSEEPGKDPLMYFNQEYRAAK